MCRKMVCHEPNIARSRPMWSASQAVVAAGTDDRSRYSATTGLFSEYLNSIRRRIASPTISDVDLSNVTNMIHFLSIHYAR
jgi:hypothetical protein